MESVDSGVMITGGLLPGDMYQVCKGTSGGAMPKVGEAPTEAPTIGPGGNVHVG